MGEMQIVAGAKTFLKKVEAQYVEMMVPLYSYGCEKKVKKTLSHLKGIYSINVDYTQQKVTVWGICNKYDILEMMRSKRKEARFWNPEEEEEDNNNNNDLDLEEEEPPSKHHRTHSFIGRRSMSSWKAWKKKLVVFARSNSF